MLIFSPGIPSKPVFSSSLVSKLRHRNEGLTYKLARVVTLSSIELGGVLDVRKWKVLRHFTGESSLLGRYVAI
jgi:hypothetical protein